MSNIKSVGVLESVNQAEYDRGFEAGVLNSGRELRIWLLKKSSDKFMDSKDEEAKYLRELANSIA